MFVIVTVPLNVPLTRLKSNPEAVVEIWVEGIKTGHARTPKGKNRGIGAAAAFSARLLVLAGAKFTVVVTPAWRREKRKFLDVDIREEHLVGRGCRAAGNRELGGTRSTQQSIE